MNGSAQSQSKQTAETFKCLIYIYIKFSRKEIVRKEIVKKEIVKKNNCAYN